MKKNIRSYPPIKQWVLTGFIFCIACIAVILIRLTWLSSEYMQTAGIAQEKNAPGELIESCLGALRNHYPGNPYSKQAVTIILQQTSEWKSHNQNDDALRTLKNLRATLFGIESFYQPFSAQLHDIELQIQALEDVDHE